MLEFLHDNIHLVAVTPDGQLTGKWFGSDRAAAEAWALSENAKGRNCYFTVNVTHPGVFIKPAKSDILSVRFAHVDIDPPESGVWDRDGALLGLLAQNPSVVIDSGNGWQGLWRLTGDDPDVEETNRGLVYHFNADGSVWNKDRLLRVPGTINYPDAKKRARGRVPAAAELILNEPHAFDATVLRGHYPAPVKPPSATGGDVELGEWEVFDPPLPSDALRDLLWEEVAVGDRSGHAAKVAHLMGRESYTLEQIMGTLMNTDWPWSGTIHDQKDPERQARRKLSGVVVWPKGEGMFPDDTPRATPPRLEPPARTAARLGGYGVRKHNSMFMGIMEQLTHFSGCVYVIHTDRVLMPDGSEVNQSRFDSLMGGHTFAIDEVNEKTTKSAWEAFLKNNAFTPPIVHSTCFRPELEPFEVIQDGTWRLVNTYQPIATPRVKGDPEPFLRHMRTLFPDERDRRILLTYMASLVQNPGVKFQWWPVIQGAKGNGKTLLLSIMAYAVGDQYSHLPNTSKMTRNGINFNGWLKGKLFLGMDEVYSSQRRDFLEEFKPYVTNRRLPIESKGIDEYTGDNRANGMMLTNHKDGVPVDKDERRYAVFFTAQQTAEDCFRDGLTPAHFHTLWQWMDRDGFAVVNDFLRSYQCEAEFDPAGRASRAPRTSSTDLAIEASRGRAETEILDAIDEGRPGFKGGWVSSRALAKLMEEKRINLPRNKYRETMDGMGYVPHPGLKDGKTGGACNARWVPHDTLYSPRRAMDPNGKRGRYSRPVHERANGGLEAPLVYSVIAETASFRLEKDTPTTVRPVEATQRTRSPRTVQSSSFHTLPTNSPST